MRALCLATLLLFIPVFGHAALLLDNCETGTSATILTAARGKYTTTPVAP
ncbi:MAG: hypothetical protein LLG37_00345 [Spirochaetia bacterium]|nr:hypothetical protein [Spirochaetia bacterium]